jgi:hypothetical protein
MVSINSSSLILDEAFYGKNEIASLSATGG